MKYLIDIEQYNGPMEMLIDLIEKNKLDIYDIPISLLTDQFIFQMKKMTVEPETIADFILMASELLEIKSKVLLPKQKMTEEPDPRDDLVQRILEYKHFKEISRSLEAYRTKSLKSYERYPEEDIVQEIETITINYNVEVIKSIFENLMERKGFEQASKKNLKTVHRDEYALEKYIEYVEDTIHKNNEMRLMELAIDSSSKREVVVLFLSMLELLKRGRIIIEPIYENTDIIIKWKENEDDEASKIGH